jgi:hypothetical protein
MRDKEDLGVIRDKEGHLWQVHKGTCTLGFKIDQGKEI